MIRRRVVFPIFIVLLVSCLCASLSFVLLLGFSAISPDPPNPPNPLPSLSDKAEKILAIEEGGFYDANLIVKTINDQIYSIRVGGRHESWQIGSQTYRIDDVACQHKIEKRLEAVIGRITDCREISLLGEWCPGPTASFAIDSNGDLWEMFTDIPCYPILVLFSAFLGAIFFTVGIIIVIVRILFHKRNAGDPSRKVIAA